MSQSEHERVDAHGKICQNWQTISRLKANHQPVPIIISINTANIVRTSTLEIIFEPNDLGMSSRKRIKSYSVAMTLAPVSTDITVIQASLLAAGNFETPAKAASKEMERASKEMEREQNSRPSTAGSLASAISELVINDNVRESQTLGLVYDKTSIQFSREKRSPSATPEKSITDTTRKSGNLSVGSSGLGADAVVNGGWERCTEETTKIKCATDIRCGIENLRVIVVSTNVTSEFVKGHGSLDPVIKIKINLPVQGIEPAYYVYAMTKYKTYSSHSEYYCGGKYTTKKSKDQTRSDYLQRSAILMPGEVVGNDRLTTPPSCSIYTS